MQIIIGFSLFVAGLLSFSMASTSGEPGVCWWMIAAVLTLGGSALCIFESSKKDFKK